MLGSKNCKRGFENEWENISDNLKTIEDLNYQQKLKKSRNSETE